MARAVKFRIRDNVAIVTLASPPANAISADVRAGLWDVFGRIDANHDASAAILIAEGGSFSGGADIRDYSAPEAAPTLTELCRRIETCRVPVIAGLHGVALGAGADLALACHYRLANSEAQLGLPDVTLGLVPSGGATQRLPRIVGPETALDLLLSGRSLPADVARAVGLLDGIVTGHLHTGSWSYAKALAERGTPPRPMSDRRDGLVDGIGYLATVTERRRALGAGHLFAPQRLVDCVEAAALLPFEAGLAFEADCAERCRTHPQSAALRHVFLAERTAPAHLLTRVEGVLRVADPKGGDIVRRLNHVLGGSAQALLAAGHSQGEIDSALIDYGFARAPFGGRSGGAGRAGVAVARRIVAALMVEGARQIEAGAVPRASDIDALCVHGLGFPRFRGGPMHAATQDGLIGLRKDLRDWSADSPLWEAPALLGEAIKTAAGFDGLPDAS